MFFKGKYINEFLIGRNNNFDIIRFVAATLVIFSHAYPITYGNNGSEPFAILTSGQMTYGELAVSIFFFISGFLITQSLDRSKNLAYYFKARFLRIFPALIVCILFSVFVLGPIFTEYSLIEYFTDLNTYQYIMGISLYFIQYDLPGVFTSNTWPVAINGSIWTLWYEFFFYIFVAIVGITTKINKWFVLTLYLINIFFFSFGIGGFYSELFIYFGAGMLYYLFKNWIKLNGIFAILSFIIVLFTARTDLFNFTFAIFGGFLILYLAFNPKIKLNNFGKYGDFSYGIYIYGFPVQQTMTYLFHNQLTPGMNFLLSFPVALLFAILSWNFVEKRALNYKKIPIRNLIKATQNRL